MFIRTAYFFIVNILLFLSYQKAGIVIVKLNGPAAVYALAGLFSSASTLVLFLLSSLIYSKNMRRWRLFWVEFTLTLFASIMPLILLLGGDLLFGAYVALGLPIITKLLSAWALSLPIVWLGWSALTFLLFHWMGAPESTKVMTLELDEPRPAQSTSQESFETKTLSSENQYSNGGVVGATRCMRLYDYACLQIEDGNYQSAQPILSNVMSMLMKESLVDPALMLKVSISLADCLSKTGDYNAAADHYERSLMLLSSMPAGDGRLLVDVMMKLKICYQKSILDSK